MQKIRIYNGITFAFDVQLNTEVERQLDGTRFHTLTVTADNYKRSYKINDRHLVVDVEKAEQDARDFAEGKKVIDPAILSFQSLGFE